MYNHAPEKYTCPFCIFVQGIENEHTQLKQTDVIIQTANVTAFMATRKWENNVGHVLIIPNKHIENIYDLPLSISAEIHKLAKDIALAMKSEYKCDGIMLRQHNEPAGDQHIWHYHLHIIPRYENDNIQNTQKVSFPANERAKYVQILRKWLKNKKLNYE
jgi:histidine triad (HIT) family protein